jgi:putative ABC transport system ATP-binding protein
MALAVNISNLSKIYLVGEVEVQALQKINLKVQEGEYLAVVGPSGSGKTTLLNLIAGIDRPTSGKISVFRVRVDGKDENFLADFRSLTIGFVFQSYNLVSTLTVSENIAFPMEWTRKPEKEIVKRSKELLTMFDIQHRANHFSAQLSGGEKQRVAFARALANDPPLILADEPTGNLDKKNSQKIVEILAQLKSEGKTVIVCGHDSKIVGSADRIIYLENGRVVNHIE